MMLNKKVIESVAVLGLATVVSITAVTNSEKAVIANTSLEYDGIAGVTAALVDYQQDAVDEYKIAVSVVKDDVVVVSATQEEAMEEELSAEEQAWQANLMANVDDFLNVRTEASAESAIAGKLYKGDVATIVESGEEWTQITSGNLTGYVKNEYCLTGSDAYAYAQSICDTVAEVNTNNLRIRSEQSVDSKILDTVSVGNTLVVDKEAEVSEGWVAVKSGSQTAYVSADYVTVKLGTGVGITIAEEQAAIEAAQAAAAAEEAAKNQTVSAGTETTQGESLVAAVDDVTLLAAIIQCEAGGDIYESQLGVGAVVINRVKSGAYPNSISEVIYQRGQFGPASSGKLARVLASGSISGTAYQAATDAINGVDNTGGCLGCRGASSGHAGTVIGAMVFY